MTSRQVQNPLPPEGVKFWRADAYRLPEEGLPGYVEAEPGAAWEAATPTEAYKPAGKKAEPEAGPHLDFLRLKNLLQNDPRSFERESLSFANRYGLLGLFRENYEPANLPGHKLWVAPEAVVGADGTLRRVEPAAEGTEMLLDLLDRQGYFDAEGSRFEGKHRARESARSRVAMPSEVTFVRRSYRGPWRGDASGYVVGSAPVGWEEAREPYGALLVLAEDTSSRFDVLSTREHSEHWRTALMDFPRGELGPEDKVLRLNPEDKVLRSALNSRLSAVAPYSPQNEPDMHRGWRCSSLLEALYLMLWLDTTGGRSVVKCQAGGCPHWFRQGSQPNSKFCPHPDGPGKISRCALRDAKRASRRRQAEADALADL